MTRPPRVVDKEPLRKKRFVLQYFGTYGANGAYGLECGHYMIGSSKPKRIRCWKCKNDDPKDFDPEDYS